MTNKTTGTVSKSATAATKATQSAANTSTQSVTAATPATDGANAEQGTNFTGRSVFAIETTAAGIVVRTAFMTDDNRLLNMPAVFPDVMYASEVIDDLKRQVAQHFSQAAQVGAKVIAEQAAAKSAGVESVETVKK